MRPPQAASAKPPARAASMSSLMKKEMIEAYFRALRRRIELLSEMHSRTLTEEALILCIVYIDWLASGHYGGTGKGNKHNFCRALMELGGKPVFRMFHPLILLEHTDKHAPAAETEIKVLITTNPGQFLGESDVYGAFEGSSLSVDRKKKVLAELWKTSMAARVYDWCRNRLIHGPGYITVSFDQTVLPDGSRVWIDFELLYGALKSIFNEIERMSIEKCLWFGNAKSDSSWR